MAHIMLSLLLITLLFDPGLTLTQDEIDQFQVRNTGSCASVSATPSQDGQTFTITGNGMPDHEAGTCGCECPPKYQNVDITLPVAPSITGERYATSPSVVGYAKNGVAFFNPLNGPGENAATGPNEEIFDTCNGHAEPNQDMYHYHKIPICLFDSNNKDTEQFMGVALDGLPIYSSWQADLGRHATNADLDECHGRDNGQGYRYVINGEFPYIFGCFRAEPTSMNGRQAVTVADACEGFTNGALCDHVHGTVTYDGPQTVNWDEQVDSNACCVDVKLRTGDECDADYPTTIDETLTEECNVAMGGGGGMGGGPTCPDGSRRLPPDQVDPNNPGDPPGCPSSNDESDDSDDDAAGTTVATIGIIAVMNLVVQVVVYAYDLI